MQRCHGASGGGEADEGRILSIARQRRARSQEEEEEEEEEGAESERTTSLFSSIFTLFISRGL
jgi:hypothetical protein